VSRRLIVLTVLLGVKSATGQVVPDSEAAARDAFNAGLTLFKDGRYADALRKFEEANSLSPRAGNSFNIGRCHEQLKDGPAALKAYREFLRKEPQGKQRAEAEAAVGRMEALLRQRGVQQVAVWAEPEGTARVKVDERELGAAPVVLELGQGPHQFEVTAVGYVPIHRSHTVSLEHAIDLTFILERTDAAAARRASIDASAFSLSRPRRWTWVASALAGVAIALGVGLGAFELVAEGDLRASVPARPGADNQRLAERATTLGIGANVAWVSAGVLAIGAVLLYVFEGR
jgi:tetratricopeptide (TPR) repeat protein